MGNEAVHQLQVPQIEKILLILQVIDNILNDLYIIKKIAEELPHFAKSYPEFENLLDKCISLKKVNQTYTLKNILAKSQYVSKDDLYTFEEQLVDKINKGEYSRLSLAPIKEEDKPQQYKINSI